MSKKISLAMLAVVLVVAAFVRAPMITTGLPYLLVNPDEYAICNAGYENVKYSHLDSHLYLYPFYSIYAYTLADYAVFWPGFLKHDKKDLEPRDFYITDRSLSFAFSLASIVLAFILCSLLAGPGAGLAAAILIAGSSGLVESSCLIKPDAGMTTFSLAAFIMIVKSRDNPSFKNLFLGSFLSLAAFFFKYNTAAIFIPLGLVAFQLFKVRANRKEMARAYGLAALVFVLSLVPVYRGLFDLFLGFRSNLSTQVLSGGFHINTYFLKYFFTKGAGPIPAMICFSGLAFLLIKTTKESILVTSFIMIEILFLFTVRVEFDQYAWMPLAFLCVTGGIALAMALPKKFQWFAPLIAAAAVLFNFGAISGIMTENTTEDTRITAKKWIENNIPADEPVIYSMHGPPMSDYDPAIDGNASLVDPSRNITFSTMVLYPERTFGYRYYILTSFDGKPNDGIQANFGKLVATFSSAFPDRPDIGIFENVQYYKCSPRHIADMKFNVPANWTLGFRDRQTFPSIGPYGSEGVKLIFKDVERKTGFHFFIQHTDFNAMYSWHYIKNGYPFLRMTLQWPKEARLDISLFNTSGDPLFLLEGKRGLGRPAVFYFPLAVAEVTGINFSLNMPHVLRETNKFCEADIIRADIVSIPPY